METNAALALKQKYGLVHVPNQHKIESWKKMTIELLKQAYPTEQAGMEAAKKVFTYEYKEQQAFSGLRVIDILKNA